jgi:hypothetical protein
VILAGLQRVRMEVGGDNVAAEVGARHLLMIDPAILDAGSTDLEERMLLVRDRGSLGEIIASDRKGADEACALLTQAIAGQVGCQVDAAVRSNPHRAHRVRSAS